MAPAADGHERRRAGCDRCRAAVRGRARPRDRRSPRWRRTSTARTEPEPRMPHAAVRAVAAPAPAAAPRRRRRSARRIPGSISAHRPRLPLATRRAASRSAPPIRRRPPTSAITRSRRWSARWRAASSPSPRTRPRSRRRRSAFLAADVAFVARAPEGKLLPVVDAYRRRSAASRVSRGVARTAEHRARLSRDGVSRRAPDDRARRRRRSDGRRRARARRRSRVRDGPAADGDGRVSARRRRGRRGTVPRGARTRAGRACARPCRRGARATSRRSASLCPPDLLTDPETVWVRAELALAQQRLHDRARALLSEIGPTLGKLDQGAVIADLGAVAEATGRRQGGAQELRAAARRRVRRTRRAPGDRASRDPRRRRWRRDRRA